MTQPYICPCGEVIDVAGISRGAPFTCPCCSGESRLEEADPRLIVPGDRVGGVFDTLLRERLEKPGALPVATARHGIAATGSRGSSVTGARTGARVDETTPVPAGGAGRATGGAPRGAVHGAVHGATQDAVEPPGETQSNPAIAADGTLAPGSRIGVFRIDGILGRGGMGVVYEAFDSQLQRTVALKVLGAEYVRDDEHVDRFQREARSAASLSHPNITHIYGMGTDHGIHWFAMELVRGRTLAQVIEEDGPLAPEVALDYLHQVTLGMRAAHAREIIHRDLKPTNLIVSEHGLVKITDFGLAKLVTSSVEITATGIVMGTPLYMSPEQGRGDAVDHRSDIYSLGCTFYHLLVGRPPYEGDTAMSVIVRHVTGDTPALDLPEGAGERIGRIVTRMMRKPLSERFQSYEELLTAVTAARNTSTKLDLGVRGRMILFAEHPDPTTALEPMSLKQLSVADVNLGLGRHEKSLALYEKVLEDHPELEVELGFRLLKIHQETGNEAAELALYRRLLELSEHPAERTYCRWKLLVRHLRRLVGEVGDTRGALEELLGEELPEELPTRRLLSRVEQLRDLEERLREDHEGGLLLIRRSGDLQLELD